MLQTSREFYLKITALTMTHQVSGFIIIILQLREALLEISSNLKLYS